MRVPRWKGLAVLTLWAVITPRADLLGQERVTLWAHGGLGLPVGAFGDQIGEDAGLAKTGFLLGVDVVVPIRPVSGLGWASHVEGASFGVDDEVVTELTGGLGSELTFDVGRYWMMTAFTGLRYSLPILQGLGAYGVAQLGAGMYKGPDASIVYLGTDYRLESSWEPLKGVSAGVGATVNDRFLLEVRWLHFFNPEMNGELRYLSEVEQLTGEQSIAWVQVVAGVRVF